MFLQKNEIPAGNKAKNGQTKIYARPIFGWIKSGQPKLNPPEKSVRRRFLFLSFSDRGYEISPLLINFRKIPAGKNAKNSQKGRRGQVRTEEAELALTTSFLRRTLSVVGVRSQAKLLLGRLEVIGPGAAAAAGRRNYALNQERIWANQRRADALSRLQGKAILRRGFFKID